MKTMLIGLALATLAGAAVAQDMPPPPPHHPGGGMLMRADTNGDGVITREEVVAQATQRFDRMDANHDGKLTRDELAKLRDRVRAMHDGDMPPPPPAD